AVLPAEIPDFARLLLADDARQIAGAKAAVEAADDGTGLAEDGVVGGDGQIADDVQDVPPADGVARHQGDNWLGHRADDALQLQYVAPGQAVLVDVARLAAYLLVAARAERVDAIPGRRAVAGQQHDADLGVHPRQAEGLRHLVD